MCILWMNSVRLERHGREKLKSNNTMKRKKKNEGKRRSCLGEGMKEGKGEITKKKVIVYLEFKLPGCQIIDKERKRSLLIAMEKIDELPPPLFIEILLRLPVKDLLKLKGVCKSWHSIISSPCFISLHLKNYHDNNDSRLGGWLLVHYHVSYAEVELYGLLVDETPQILAVEEIESNPLIRNSYICGPCNGIYYLYSYTRRHHALLNPAINEINPLPEIISKPHLPSNITDADVEGYGFGLDPITGDYKVVVIKSYCSKGEEVSFVEHPLSVFVYSVRTNCWRYCGDLNGAYLLEINRCYMYMDGYYFWHGSYNNYCNDVIVSFDMATDVFNEMDAPDYARPSTNCVGIYDDSLAFLSLHETSKILDIWTRKEGCCWTKKLMIGPLPHIWIPIGHWKRNYILLEDEGGQLLLIDPDSLQLKNLGFVNRYQCYGAFAYMQSLVSFKDMTTNLGPATSRKLKLIRGVNSAQQISYVSTQTVQFIPK